ncbi:tail protein X [Enterobacter cloacae]|uniref:tail protein X n=1 Tax=Enterobacter cloacae TaxID=550 RepID=UPI00345DA132
MATIYTNRAGDMLDDICWRYYGSERQMMPVLDAQSGAGRAVRGLSCWHHDHPS